MTLLICCLSPGQLNIEQSPMIGNLLQGFQFFRPNLCHYLFAVFSDCADSVHIDRRLKILVTKGPLSV